MVAALAIGGTMAYLTDSETADNVFTLGSVKIDLEEPHYPGNGSAEVTDIVPNEEVQKDPLVKNTGDNDAIVFLKMTVPVETVQAVDDDGTKHESAPSELFFFKTGALGEGFTDHTNKFNEKWERLEDKETGADLAGTERTYVFAYKTKLAPGASTDALFDKIQLKNYAEGYIDGSVENIKIDTYAIQADNLIVSQAKADPDNLTPDSEKAIYDLFMKQNPEINTNGSTKDAENNNALNLKGDPRTTQDNVTLSINIAVDNTKLITGNTAQASAAVDTTMEEQGYTFASSDESVAKVDAATGKITAIAPGKATITATSKAKKNDTAATASVDITVEDAVSVSMGMPKKKLQVGDTVNAAIQVNATTEYTVVYSSSDESVATVDSGSGKVTAVGAGSAIITATVTYRDQAGVSQTHTASDRITVDVQAVPVG